MMATFVQIEQRSQTAAGKSGLSPLLSEAYLEGNMVFFTGFSRLSIAVLSRRS